MLHSKKIIFSSSMLLLMIVFTSCSNKNLNLDEKITTIAVYEYGEDVLIDTIADKQLIKNLVEELDKATTKSTANLDYELPDYELIFDNEDEEEVFTIGYYKEVVNLGVKGRYLDVEEDLMYQVDTKLLTK